jgi:single-strand DNA-binding protein
MYQKLVIIGNLGRDPDCRFLPEGRAVTTLSVATNRQYKGSDGQQVKETAWFRVSVFGKMAEACAEYLKKGRMCLVEGRLQPDKNTGGPRIWEKQDGTPAASFEVIAQEVKFLPTANGNGGNAKNNPPREDDFEDVPGSGAPAADGWGDDDEQIPL